MDRNDDKQKILQEEKEYTKYQTLDSETRDSSRDRQSVSQHDNDFTSGDYTSERKKYGGRDTSPSYEQFRPPLQQEPSMDKQSPYTKPTYSNRKTMSQGAMDFALLMSNLAQLVILLDVKGKDNTIVIKLLTVMTILSIIMQAVVAIMLTIMAQMKIRSEEDEIRVGRMSEATSVLILIVSIINVINSSMQIERNGTASEAKANKPVDVLVTNSSNLLKQLGEKAREFFP